MPELPDVVLYVDALSRLLSGATVERIIIKSPFLLRTFDPGIETVESRKLTGFSRIGKRIIWQTEDGIKLVFHLMIAGRFHWKADRKRMPNSKMDLAAFQFSHGTMMLTEASKKKRASLHILPPEDDLKSFDRGGLEPLECTYDEFAAQLKTSNRTLKRALTDPTIFSGIGNAYSDEILLAARLSPLKRTAQLKPDQTRQLYEAMQSQLKSWVERLMSQHRDKFPEKVTAFRPEMGAHGKFGMPCPHCQTAIQRIRYAENECNYCPRCQTDGKLLADRSLSRLLKDDWPKTIEELEGQ